MGDGGSGSDGGGRGDVDVDVVGVDVDVAEGPWRNGLAVIVNVCIHRRNGRSVTNRERPRKKRRGGGSRPLTADPSPPPPSPPYFLGPISSSNRRLSGTHPRAPLSLLVPP